MKKVLNLITLNLMIVAFLFWAAPALAAPPTCPAISSTPTFAEILRRVACKAGFITADNTQPVTETDVVTIIGSFISMALAFVGVIFVLIMIYGGWLWGSARGNEEQVKEAERLIRNAVLGAIVTFATFALSRFVINAINTSFGS